MNTSRCGSRRIAGCRSVSHTRRRSATSARAHSDAISCFFICEPGPPQQPRERPLGPAHPALGQQPRGQLEHGDVRLGFDRRDQVIEVVGQRPLADRAPLPARGRTALTRCPCTPPDRRTHAHRKSRRSSPPRCSIRNRLNHPKPQIHRSTCTHDPPPRSVNHIRSDKGILRFTNPVGCSSAAPARRLRRSRRRSDTMRTVRTRRG